MSQPLIFKDLSGLDPDRALHLAEREWIQRLAQDTDASDYVVDIGVSCVSRDSEPILSCDARGKWKAGRYIGELYRDGQVLEIRPRLSIETVAEWASAALNVRIVPRSAQHTSSSTLIAELLAATWRAALVDAARHGLPSFRAPRRHSSSNVLGRLDVPATVALRATRQPKVASISTPKQFNNPVTSAIVLADRTLDRALKRKGWRGQRVDELMPHLRASAGGRPVLPSRRELKAVRYTPITLPYRRIADLSWQIARHRGLHTSATGQQSDGLLIDVAELWELFLLHCAKRAFGAANVTHGTRLKSSHALLQSVSEPSRVLGRLYPDLIIGPPNHPWAIIDAKYKPLADPRGVDRADLYQLHAYLGVHVSHPLPIGALCYVEFPGQRLVSRAETTGLWQTRQGHQVRFQRLPVTERECVQALRKLVGTHAIPASAP